MEQFDYFEEQKKVLVSGSEYSTRYDGLFPIYAVNNVFNKIDPEEFNKTIGVVMDSSELIDAQSKIDTWNISFTGKEHQKDDIIFWFVDGIDFEEDYGVDDYILRTLSEKELPILLSEYKFVGYKKVGKKSDILFKWYVDSASVNIDKFFPVFIKV
jgi:hypothetical protein